MEELKDIIARNLVMFRKEAKLTQGELADKLQYSDKAISKWERGESIPDIFVLNSIAGLYGVTLNDLVSDKPIISVKSKKHKLSKIQKVLIIALSCLLVWSIATFCYIVPNFLGFYIGRLWLIFIYAIPISLIIVVVFTTLWARAIWQSIAASLLMWSICLTIYLTFSWNNIWLIFILGIPLQVMIILWYLLVRIKRINKKENIEKN